MRRFYSGFCVAMIVACGNGAAETADMPGPTGATTGAKPPNSSGVSRTSFGSTGGSGAETGTTSAGDTATTGDPAPDPTSHAALLAELEGFGEDTIGGRDGPERWVTTVSDSGPGSLRVAVEAGGWVRFDPAVFPVDGDARIHLESSIDVPSDVTIDGRGARVVIEGHGLFIDASNVIVNDLVFDFTGAWTPFEGNAAIMIGWPEYGAQYIWVHHNSFIGAGPQELDGAVDVLRRAHDITISWNRFEDWDKAILLGTNASDVDEAPDRITFHHNYFARGAQRQPLARFGRFHIYNNWYRDWRYNANYGEAIVSSAGAQVLSERNVFDHEQVGFKAIYLSNEGGAAAQPGYVEDRGSYFAPGVGYDLDPTGGTFAPDYDYAASEVAIAGQQQALRDTLASAAGWRGT